MTMVFHAMKNQALMNTGLVDNTDGNGLSIGLLNYALKYKIDSS